jgi:hypothetical protein
MTQWTSYVVRSARCEEGGRRGGGVWKREVVEMAGDSEGEGGGTRGGCQRKERRVKVDEGW